LLILFSNGVGIHAFPIADRAALGLSAVTIALRVHSGYERSLSDLPWAGKLVRLRLKVRRFFCLNEACPRRTFAERLDHIAAYARRTDRMAEALRQIALEIGAENGARLAKRLAMPTSPDILLSLIKKASPAAITPPQVVGIDDWARLRGRTYGTIVVDLQLRRPLALLPHREAGEVANWLSQYPSIKVVSRDRSSIYTEAARSGAPQALQVADKFHLIKNLTETIEVFLQTHTKLLREVATPTPTPTTAEPLEASSKVSAKVSQPTLVVVSKSSKAATISGTINTTHTICTGSYTYAHIHQFQPDLLCIFENTALV
jgi:hypothetical protein